MDLLRRAFRDIAAGHTRATITGRAAFIRHLSYADQIQFDERRDAFYAEARALSIPTDEERLAAIIASGEWSHEKEREVATAKNYIGSLEEGRRKPNLHPSQVKAYAAKIADAEKDYHAKAMTRRRAMGRTCEVVADEEVNDYYIVTNLYADAAMTQPLFGPGEFEYLQDDEVGALVADYNRAMEGCSDRNVRRLAMAPFFQSYFQLAGEDYTSFFSKAICHLTFYQKDLLRWGAHFSHIYATHDVSSWRKEVLEDPDLMTDYATAVTKGKEDLAAKGANEPGAIVIGAKPEDAKVLGIKAADPMKQIMAAHGGNVMAWAAAQGG